MSSISSLTGGASYLTAGLSSILDYSGSSSSSKSSATETSSGTGSFFVDILSSLTSADTSGVNNSVYMDSANSRIGQLDTDGDGALSESESKLKSNAFSSLDTDGNGSLTAQELSNVFMAVDVKDASSLISTSDTDGDGKLSSSELGWDESIFSSLDANGDGTLDVSELVNAKTARNAELKSFFSGRDANGDGALSSDELGVSQDLFNQADKDGDGSLTKQEAIMAYPMIKNYTDTGSSQASSVNLAA